MALDARRVRPAVRHDLNGFSKRARCELLDRLVRKHQLRHNGDARRGGLQREHGSELRTSPQNPDGSEFSVLAPVGTALLGMRAGESIEWRLPTGRTKRYRVLSVTYQPEVAGDLRS